MIDDLRDGRGVRWRNAYVLVSAQTLKGVRPRDWDAAAIDELSKADSDNPLFRTTSRLFLFVHAMDRGHDADIARYRTLLEGNLDGVPSRLRHEIHVELAIGAWLAGDTVAVRRHLTAGKDGTVDGPRRLLAQAALARLEDGSRADAWPAMPRPQTGPNRDRTSRTARPRLVAVRRSARRGARSRMTSGDSVPSP